MIILMIIRARKVHHCSTADRAQRPPPIKKRPTYQMVSRLRMMYSSACQEISCDDFAIVIL